jgi:hypothetical protein
MRRYRAQARNRPAFACGSTEPSSTGRRNKLLRSALKEITGFSRTAGTVGVAVPHAAFAQALNEANVLNQQVIRLNDQGRYSEAPDRHLGNLTWVDVPNCSHIFRLYPSR